MWPELKEHARPLVGWEANDMRWARLQYYLSRVRDAGLTLVSKRDRERLVERHLIPSLEALPFLASDGYLMDIGSGGGFPAVPLAMARPGLQVLCIESNSRKAAFLRRVSRETELRNVQIVESRVENLEAAQNQTADYLTARAVADLTELFALTARFLRPSGRWLLWKGRDWRREGDLAQLGVRLVEEHSLSDGGRLLIIVPANMQNLP